MSVATAVLNDGKTVKLGRIRPVAILEDDPKYRVLVFPGGKARATLKMHAYFTPDKATPPPAKVDWYSKVPAVVARMYLNDTYGDCVIAGKYHQVGVWSGNDTTQGTPTAVQGTDQEVYTSYQTICGPGDNGCIITDVLDYFQRTGLKFNGIAHKIDGYVSIDWTNKLMVQAALQVFGSLTIGINLPNAWTCTNCTWDTTNANIVGGHDVCCVGYDDVGVQILTWGGLVTITWAAFLSKSWIEECYAELSPDWYGADSMAANGIDAATLKADLQKLGGGVIPDPGPGPQPPTPLVIQSVTPNSGPPGTVVTLAGTGFTSNSKVSIGNIAVPTMFANPTLTAPVPVLPNGPANVQVIDGTSAAMMPGGFTVVGVTPPPPPPVPPSPITSTGVVHIPATPLAGPFGVYLKTQAVDVPVTVTSQNSATAAGITIPPWLIPILQGLCSQSGKLPQPWAALAALVCGFLPPAATPCGCK